MAHDRPSVAFDVEGFEHVLTATGLIKEMVEDLFLLPEAAQRRAVEERERLGDAHGDDLVCGCWNAAETAQAMLELAGRHADAVVQLADLHPGFAPSAAVLARASGESLFRARWLLEPADARDREQRWIALKHEEGRFYKAVGQRSDAEFQAEHDALDRLSAVVGGAVVPGILSVEQMAKDYGRTPALYEFYRWNSQSTHGTIVGSRTFDPETRQLWYRAGGSGEWVEAEFWSMPLIAVWESATVALPAFRDLFCPDQPLRSLGEAKDGAFHTALRKLPANYQARESARLRNEEAKQTLSALLGGNRTIGNRAQRRKGAGPA